MAASTLDYTPIRLIQLTINARKLDHSVQTFQSYTPIQEGYRIVLFNSHMKSVHIWSSAIKQIYLNIPMTIFEMTEQFGQSLDNLVDKDSLTEVSDTQTSMFIFA